MLVNGAGRSCPPRCFFVSRALTYALDTNVGSYILNGELWLRSPLDLLIHLNANNVLEKFGGLERFSQSNTVKRYLASYEWAKSLKRRLFLPPTVVDELTLSKQVGVKLLCGLDIGIT